MIPIDIDLSLDEQIKERLKEIEEAMDYMREQVGIPEKMLGSPESIHTFTSKLNILK